MLKVNHLSFSYNKTPILQDISFEVLPGEHVSIIGESGSGKSTLLKLLYGEMDLDHGQIFWKDTEVLGPKHNLVVGYPFMKFVAQEFDLMPFITVEENVGKHLSNFYPEEKQKRVEELLEVVGLTDFAKVKVKTLSGGQKQRVALARAIAKEPEIMLLDEPFGHIDNFKKHPLRRNFFNYLKQNNVSCVVATHDKEDVLPYSDKMIVLNEHKILEQGTPMSLYNHPKNKLVASFFEEYNKIDEKIVYAHQLKVVNHSEMESVIKKSYFLGQTFLIEAIYKGQSIYFHHAHALEEGETVFLSISK